MSPFLFNFNFLHNKFFYQKQKKIKKKYFQKNNFPKKVVPAITDICTGGQQCKYELLGSGVNISYYLHGGELFCYCSKKNMKGCRYHSQVSHTHTSWHYEVTVKFATRNMLYLLS